MRTRSIILGPEPEWSNPQIEDGKLPEMPIYNYIITDKLNMGNLNHQLMNHTIRKFPSWYNICGNVYTFRGLDHSGSQPFIIIIIIPIALMK